MIEDGEPLSTRTGVCHRDAIHAVYAAMYGAERVRRDGARPTADAPAPVPAALAA